MGELCILIIVLIVFCIKNVVDDFKLNNYDLSKIDNKKMSADAGKSVNTIRKNMISGKYDK